MDKRVRCGNPLRTTIRSGAILRPAHVDRAKALVVAHISQLVSEGYAKWDMLDDGKIRVRFDTGEVFLLAEAGVTRTR